jgi:hypothetical protein
LLIEEEKRSRLAGELAKLDRTAEQMLANRQAPTSRMALLS